MTLRPALLLALLALAPASARAAGAEAAPEDGLAAPAVPSILGAESLQGGSSVLAWAGYGRVGGAYGQGITSWDDLILQLDFDWAYTEFTPSLAWKRPIAWSGPWTLAMRLGVGWYVNLGGTWIHGFNDPDRGLALAPAVVASTHAGEGLVAFTVEAPITMTRWRSGGYMLAPKAALSFETPLYGDLTMGIGTGLRWRVGAGGAPSTAGRTDLELLVYLGHRVL